MDDRGHVYVYVWMPVDSVHSVHPTDVSVMCYLYTKSTKTNPDPTPPTGLQRAEAHAKELHAQRPPHRHGQERACHQRGGRPHAKVVAREVEPEGYGSCMVGLWF